MCEPTTIAIGVGLAISAAAASYGYVDQTERADAQNKAIQQNYETTRDEAIAARQIKSVDPRVEGLIQAVGVQQQDLGRLAPVGQFGAEADLPAGDLAESIDGRNQRLLADAEAVVAHARAAGQGPCVQGLSVRGGRGGVTQYVTLRHFFVAAVVFVF